MTRYIYHEEPVPPADAKAEKAARVEHALARVREATDEYLETVRAPLCTHRTIQTTLNPGDPGYDEAPVRMDPVKWQGDYRWLNPRTTTDQ